MKKRMVFLALALVMVLVLTACNPFQMLLDQIEGTESASESMAEDSSVDERDDPLQPTRPQQDASTSQGGDASALPGQDNALKVDDLDDLTGTWWNLLDEEEGLIYQLKFGERPGHMQAAAGYYQSDAGHYYGGPYDLAEPGVLACSLQYEHFDSDGSEPYTNVMYRMAWVDESKTTLKVTLVYIDEDSGPDDGTGFADLFYPMMDVELLMEKQ